MQSFISYHLCSIQRISKAQNYIKKFNENYIKIEKCNEMAPIINAIYKTS